MTNRKDGYKIVGSRITTKTILLEKERINKYVNNTCKIRQGNMCCRYLTTRSDGFECQKHTSLKLILDTKAENETMIARANNCDGNFGKDNNE